MLILFSHALAFSVLLIASYYDLKTSEVPDFVMIPGVLGGIILHAIYSVQTGSADPILWSLGVGTVFSVYGWFAYYQGWWGGADAFAVSVLGFATPFSLEGISYVYSMNLFLNMLYVGFLYTILFSLIKAYRNIDLLSSFYSHLKENKRLLTFELGAVTAFSIFLSLQNLSGILYFAILFSMVLLLHFLRNIEENVFRREEKIENVSPGQVVETEELDEKIKGVTEEELRSITADKVIVKEGIRFIPVFPVALLITDTLGGGIETILWLMELLSV